MTRRNLLGWALMALLIGLAGAARPAEARGRVPRQAAKVTGKVNLNTASVKQLRLLPRVGRTTANAIVAYRAQKQFRTIREVMRVKGIGKRTFLKLKRHLAVRGPNTIKRYKPAKRGTRTRKPARRARRTRRR
jgi:competence protein ComEA